MYFFKKKLHIEQNCVFQFAKKKNGNQHSSLMYFIHSKAMPTANFTSAQQVPPINYMLNSSSTLMSFLSNGLSERIASENGTYTTSLFLMPIITLRCP